MNITLTVGHAKPGDEPALFSLWTEVFGDEKELIDGFFEHLYAPEFCSVARLGDEIISAGYCIPGAISGDLKCSYIYTMATNPERRGLGAASMVAHALVNNAFSGGADLVVTLPASESLCGWYERVLGMTPAFKKGGDGVIFPDNWHKFAKICGEHSEDTPTRLYAVAREGLRLDDIDFGGWELTFD